jgi:osmotically-inducible protein OsmY
MLLSMLGCRTNETPESQVNDAEILASVKAKLAEGIGASTVANISVNVTNGVVSLAGTAHNADEKSKAISIAQGVPKVVRVNDNLQISSAPPG